MKRYGYSLPENCNESIRSIFPHLHDGQFNNLIFSASQALVQYDQSKCYHSQYHEKPSENIRRLKGFTKHAKALRSWMKKDWSCQDYMFNGIDLLDAVDNDDAIRIDIANTRNALDRILYQEIENAERAISCAEDIATEPRISPALFRRELFSSLALGYSQAFGYLPSVYWDESRGSDCSEDCIQGKFIDFVELILKEANEPIGRHSIYSECKKVLSELNRPMDEQDWKHLI